MAFKDLYVICLSSSMWFHLNQKCLALVQTSYYRHVRFFPLRTYCRYSKLRFSNCLFIILIAFLWFRPGIWSSLWLLKVFRELGTKFEFCAVTVLLYYCGNCGTVGFSISPSAISQRVNSSFKYCLWVSDDKQVRTHSSRLTSVMASLCPNTMSSVDPGVLIWRSIVRAAVISYCDEPCPASTEYWRNPKFRAPPPRTVTDLAC